MVPGKICVYRILHHIGRDAGPEVAARIKPFLVNEAELPEIFPGAGLARDAPRLDIGLSYGPGKRQLAVKQKMHMPSALRVALWYRNILDVGNVAANPFEQLLTLPDDAANIPAALAERQRCKGGSMGRKVLVDQKLEFCLLSLCISATVLFRRPGGGG